MFSRTGSGAERPFSMPSSPACSITASARYGLLDGSGERSSIREAAGTRAAGFRTRAERLTSLQAT